MLTHRATREHHPTETFHARSEKKILKSLLLGPQGRHGGAVAVKHWTETRLQRDFFGKIPSLQRGFLFLVFGKLFVAPASGLI